MSQARAPIPVSLQSGTLALFDPRALEHRRTANSRWMRDAAAVRQELQEGNLVALRLGEKTAASIRVGAIPDGAARVGPFRLKVTGDSLYVGDVEDAPSKRWGRRWNYWDWLFLAFVVTCVPFLMWLVGFGSQLLWYVFYGTVFSVSAMIPISIIFFRKRKEDRPAFARKTGTPPGDHPHAVVAVEPGDYAVTFGRKDPLKPIIFVELTRQGGAAPMQEPPLLQVG